MSAAENKKAAEVGYAWSWRSRVPTAYTAFLTDHTEYQEQPSTNDGTVFINTIFPASKVPREC